MNFKICPIPRYDLPATVDLILRETGVDKINYVSHSMGGTQFLVAMSERPGTVLVIGRTSYVNHP